MKKFEKIICLLLILFAVLGCVKSIVIEGLDSESYLIVEALVTNENKKHIVKLSRTYPLDSTIPVAEPNAIVTVKDNAQNTYSFTETSLGTYTSNNSFQAEIGKNYTLEIKTSDGKTYISTPEKITGKSIIDQIVPIKEINSLNETGIKIYVKGHGLETDSKYFRYKYEETYKIITPYWSGEKLEIVSDAVPFEVKRVPDYDSKRVCYKTDTSYDINQTETASLASNNINFGVRFIEKSNFIISHRYSILVKQYVQSFEAYHYFKTLEKLSSSQGSFTQNQPGFLAGNITATNNANDKAIGYFEVNSVAQKRMFLNRSDFFPDEEANYISSCDFIAPVLVRVLENGHQVSPLIDILKRNTWAFYSDNNTGEPQLEGAYLLVPKSCSDCRKTGSDIKPTFWID